jgi:hypothetical protein
MKKKKEVRIAAKGNGVDGEIIVSAPNFYKVIPAVLFSKQEANTLLEIIDRIEEQNQ